MFLLLSTLAAGAWGLGLAAATQAQGRLIFGSPRVRRTAPAGPHAGHHTQAVALARPGGVTLQGWLTLPAAAPARLALWFGGRNEDVGWVPALASWLGPDWAVCSFNYRGCVGSTGRPGEAACVQDALHIADWAGARTGVAPARQLLMGRSLGSGVVMQAAARRGVAGLVLLTPPASVRRLVLRNPLLLPAAPWLRHPFDSLAAAQRVAAPSLMLLAERDRRVPHRESQRLAQALRQRGGQAVPDACRVLTIPATDHRSLARHAGCLAAIAQFAGTLAAAPAASSPA